jgi:hypothetical protein
MGIYFDGKFYKYWRSNVWLPLQFSYILFDKVWEYYERLPFVKLQYKGNTCLALKTKSKLGYIYSISLQKYVGI